MFVFWAGMFKQGQTGVLSTWTLLVGDVWADGNLRGGGLMGLTLEIMPKGGWC